LDSEGIQGMTVLKDEEIPTEIRSAVSRVRRQYGVGKDDVFVVDAEHEGLPEGSFAIWAECLVDYDWKDCVDSELETYWSEWRYTETCLAVHPRTPYQRMAPEEKADWDAMYDR
jgi:hypothetical protein